MSTMQRINLDGRLVALVVLAAIVGCQAQEPATNETPPETDLGGTATDTVYAYTLLVPSNTSGTLALGRVVIGRDSATCPTLTSGADSVPTVVRPTPTLGDFSGVTVCETVVDFGKAYTVSGTPITLEAVNNDPSHVLVYGDTGCKHSDCLSAAASPFDTLATVGAGLNPSLILHMGDYNYRGTGGDINEGTVYDAGDITPSGADSAACQLQSTYYSQNAPGNGPADNWTDWQLDFFEPAQDLLPTAPWVFARGNHELCSRAGPGWFYLLGPGSDGLKAAGTIPQYHCPDQKADTDVLRHLVFVDPYLVNLGTLRVLVMDSANACDDYAPDTTTALYGTQFAQLARQTSGDTATWFMTHRPLWGDDSGTIVNQTLQTALRDSLQDALPSAVRLSLAGHMHYFQSLTFTQGGRPPQLIIGNSGVSLWGDPTGDFCKTVDAMQANGNGAEAFGFLSATLGTDGAWNGNIVGQSSTVATCTTASLPNAICTLASPTGGQGCATSSP